MPPVPITQFTLGVHIDTFLELFCRTSTWYEDFLTHKLMNLSVTVSAWTPSVGNDKVLTRTIRSYHPSKISFPGLPSHAESWKVQTLEIISFENDVVEKVLLKEVTSLQGIPYADYFNVVTDWAIISSPSSSSKQPGSSPSCKVSISLEVKFLKSTWLQGTIESNTKAELVGVYELWLETANHSINTLPDNSLPRPEASIASTGDQGSDPTPAASLAGISTSGTMDLDRAVGCEEELATLLPKHPSQSDSTTHPQSDFASATAAASLAESPEHCQLLPEEVSLQCYSDNDGDEELLQFYDCEEGGLSYITSDRQKLRPHSLSKYPFPFHKRTRSCEQHPSTLSPAAELHRLHGLCDPHGVELLGSPDSDDDSVLTQDEGQYPASAQEVAMNIVETIFVFSEFSYWQIHNFYMYDMKQLLSIEPDQVLARVANSFLPGWHSPILLQPDLYGPLVAVLTLPQSLLICMETSRHGCNPTIQLGNAVVMSLFIWFGLSCLYRVLAVLIAPSIQFKHCVSMIGYSFFAWNLAILGSFPLENYHDLLKVPSVLPLVLFGVPSSLAQGFIFWEHTPSSSLILQPSALPSSMHTFGVHNNRFIQKLLWAFPKILAFSLVAGTHYQFLWYIFRVFLPGNRQLCQLSRLVQPSQYADILTQKEFRQFALSLLTGKSS